MVTELITPRRRRPAKETDAERRSREREEAQEAREQEEDEEYDAICREAWELTDEADMLGLRLRFAADVSADLFEDVRKEVETFLRDLSNPHAYLGHLQGWCMLYGLDPYTGKWPGT